MLWKKNGQILDILNDKRRPSWMHSHAQNPVAIILSDRIRIFFNSRSKLPNNEQIAYPAYIDVKKDNLSEIIGYSQKPLLQLGRRGTFDEFGVMVSSVVRVENQLWMYYVGWTRMQSVPYNWGIGLAYSNDNGETFTRFYEGPILGAHKTEAFLQNGCHVLIDDFGKWHMWYSTGQRWIEDKDKLESQYAIVYASSDNGIDWDRDGKTLLPFYSMTETQTTPSIFKHKDLYYMLFSYRNSIDFRNSIHGYKIGCAYSKCMRDWVRDDDLSGINLSDSGWDSEMICYPYVFNNNGQLQLLYSGNQFGSVGFGYATLDFNSHN